MWKDFKDKPNSGRNRNHNNRLRFVVAIIFLLSGSLLYKLFSLQIGQFDLYTAMASSQHQLVSQLKPDRGRIFFSEEINGEENLYPAATNKDFASLYAVPKDVADPNIMADQLYDFFDRSRLDKELASSSPEIASSTRAAARDLYFNRLNKPGDPYEPLADKISEEDLISFFSLIASSSTTPLSAADLEIKDEQIVYKADGQRLEVPGLGFDLKPYRYYPENEVGANILGFVSYSDGEGTGHYGLEEFFNDELFGKYGSLKSEKGGKSNLIIVNDREYTKPEPGSDFILTIDRNIEFVACEKLASAVKKHGADGGSVIVIKPQTGAIVAMCSVPSFNPNDYKAVKDISYYNNPAVFYQYEPGSVFKTITMSIAIDQGKISPSTTYEDKGQIMIKGWPKPIKNADFATHGPHGVVDMSAVLDNSLNTGAIFVMNQVGPAVFADYVKSYGFGERTGIELGSESPGDISNLLKDRVKEIDAATASFGQGIAVTPLQMIMPYQAIANKGIMMKPYIVKAIIRGDSGRRDETAPQQIGRIISEKTAATVSAMLVNVVEKGHSKGAAISGYYIGGKTGTAQVASSGGYSADNYVHTFIGIAPIDEPAFVMLTKIDNPKDAKYAESSAVPLWREIADFILKYYAVPKTRD